MQAENFQKGQKMCFWQRALVVNGLNSALQPLLIVVKIYGVVVSG